MTTPGDPVDEAHVWAIHSTLDCALNETCIHEKPNVIRDESPIRMFWKHLLQPNRVAGPLKGYKQLADQVHIAAHR
jgi:hypothetical protein